MDSSIVFCTECRLASPVGGGRAVGLARGFLEEENMGLLDGLLGDDGLLGGLLGDDGLLGGLLGGDDLLGGLLGGDGLLGSCSGAVEDLLGGDLLGGDLGGLLGAVTGLLGCAR